MNYKKIKGKSPGFFFYPGDYLRDTQNLSAESQVSYDRIMCEHMRNICLDMNNIIVSKSSVKFLTKRLKRLEKEEIMSLLIERNGGYQIEWVAISIYNTKAYSESRKQNRAGKKTNKI